MVKDEDGNPKTNEVGIPILNSEDKTKEMNEEITELLEIEIDVNLFTIDEACFDYEDTNGKYDSLSAKDILALQSILTETRDKE